MMGCSIISVGGRSSSEYENTSRQVKQSLLTKSILAGVSAIVPMVMPDFRTRSLPCSAIPEPSVVLVGIGSLQRGGLLKLRHPQSRDKIVGIDNVLNTVTVGSWNFRHPIL